jgi:sirohydrochlorin cobaltochelatase
MASASKDYVILVGHGGLPSDIPPAKIAELKRLEGERRAAGEVRMTEAEAELDAEVRKWPRTDETDPYRAGLEAVAEQLRAQLGSRQLLIAYNEFCAPSIEDALAHAVSKGAASIVLVSTMFTPGGSHSEVEIPEIVEVARTTYPDIDIRYAWPFDLSSVAGFLRAHLDDT